MTESRFLNSLCHNSFVENWKLNLLYEVSFSRDYTLSPSICHLNLHGIVLHVSVGAPNYYWDTLDSYRKICRVAGPKLPTSLEPLNSRQNVTNLSVLRVLLWRIHSAEFVESVPPPNSPKISLVI